MAESRVLATIKWQLGSRPGTRLWRCLTGKFRSFNGNRVVQAGVRGAPDLMGWHWHLVRQEDVGRLVPVFTAIEVKRMFRSAGLTREQKVFLEDLRTAGAFAGVARNVEEAWRILDQPVGVQPGDLHPDSRRELCL